MASFSDTGHLIQVPIESVEVPENSVLTVPAFQIFPLSEKLQTPGLRNWLPVIVKEASPRVYSVVANSHIFYAMQQAGQNYLWVVVIPNEQDVESQVVYLSGQNLKTNLCTANKEAIIETLRHLQSTPSNKIPTLDINLLTERILNAPSRKTWKSLKPLTNLGVTGLTAAKLKIFEQVFEAIPEPFEITPVPINTASHKDILDNLSLTDSIPEINLSRVNLKKLAQQIASNPERIFWSDFTPLKELGCNVTTAKLKGLNKIFTFTPEEPSDPYKLAYFLKQRSISELKKEAKKRGIEFSGKISKNELIELFLDDK
ncbi:SAP domain-containing protein [Thermosynechococcaceae cyanobacterium BACA0444]|uniref:SAP domain-containing protein n=1 Tax=Pseudocalidococcus azoricus BACA0444 TaxID=2918990 RepID=A0AAE4FPP1_9CYAN|nr:SAP domain-containing protein [Pseudocalidococcus azoricus]MDS3859954.1 SAP domain-containing protein [Pseudocalidococcus azoricus BACA0444]